MVNKKLIDVDFSQIRAVDLLNYIADGYFVISRDKTIVYWSEGMQKLLGHPSAAVLGRTCHDIIHNHHPDYLSAHYCPLNVVLSRGSVAQVETIVSDKQDRDIPVLATHILLEEPGSHLLVIIEDLTVRQKFMEQQKELVAAKKIHSHFLPVAPPKIRCLDIGAFYAPANVIGGDFYNFVGDHQHVGFFLGDVAGRGIPAALAVSLVTHVIRSEMSRHPDNLSSPLWALNKILYRQMDEPLFVSAIIGFYDNKENAFHFINAGHCPPLILRSHSENAFYVTSRNMALGVSESISFKSSLIRLAKNDIIVFYTDGVIESRNSLRQPFGETSFAKLVEYNRHKPAQSIADEIGRAVNQFSVFNDDTTVIVVKADQKEE